jgi:hypothetical protein
MESGVRERPEALRPSIARVALTAGALVSFVGVVLIWLARARIQRPIYVSELGARGMSTAPLFVTALLLVAVGGALIAIAGGHPRSRLPLIGKASIGGTIAVSSVCFVVASQVSCTAGCPLPLVGAGSTFQDLVHTTAAVLGFVAGCFAMLQVGFAGQRMRIARFSAAACCAVAVITIIGGMLSIFRTATDVGGVLEFIGTTVAIGWLACYGLWLAWRPSLARDPGERTSGYERSAYERPDAISASS